MTAEAIEQGIPVASKDANTTTTTVQSLKKDSSQNKTVLRAYNHVLTCGGKQVRTKMIKGLNTWLKVQQEKMEQVFGVIESFHNSSLLMDDIQDFAVLRRGRPCAHLIFDIVHSVHSGTYASFEKYSRSFPLEFMGSTCKIIAENLMKVAEGQGLDIYWRDTQTCPTVEEYLDMIDKKTTALFRMGLELLQLFSSNQQDFSKLILLIGRYFQIRDDYANLKFKEYELTKGFADDLTEGKYSYLIVHAIRSHPEDQTIQKIVEMRPTDLQTKRIAVKHIEKLGTFAHCEQLLTDLMQQIEQELEYLEPNEIMLSLLKALFIKERE